MRASRCKQFSIKIYKGPFHRSLWCTSMTQDIFNLLNSVSALSLICTGVKKFGIVITIMQPIFLCPLSPFELLLFQQIIYFFFQGLSVCIDAEVASSWSFYNSVAFARICFSVGGFCFWTHCVMTRWQPCCLPLNTFHGSVLRLLVAHESWTTFLKFVHLDHPAWYQKGRDLFPTDVPNLLILRSNGRWSELQQVSTSTPASLQTSLHSILATTLSSLSKCFLPQSNHYSMWILGLYTPGHGDCSPLRHA